MLTVELRGISEVADRYDTALVDSWGVLHNGVQAAPCAIETLRQFGLRRARVVICSNSGKSIATNVERLRSLGIGTTLFDAITTSGELAVEHLCNAFDGAAIKWIDHSFDPHLRQKLNRHMFVESIDDAEVVLLTGMGVRDTWAFGAAAQRGVPLICGNPDTVGIGPEGTRPGPGQIAVEYARLGGPVKVFGKPGPELYARFVSASSAHRAIAIGDSFPNDVCGAAAMGMDSVLIQYGIHREVFSSAPVESALSALSDLHTGGSIYPTYTMKTLTWPSS